MHARVDLDVDLVVLHRGVEVLLKGDGQTVDLIDEQDIAGLKLGKDADEVARLGQGGACGDGEMGAHLVGDDVGKGGFSQARWPVQEDVFHGLATLTGGLECDIQLFGQGGLADVLGEALGAQSEVELLVLRRAGVGGDDAVCSHGDSLTGKRERAGGDM